jgi:hypothetical protein
VHGCLGIHTVKLSHAPGEVPVRSLHHQMVMVVHEAIGVKLPVIVLNDCGKDSQKRSAILTGAKNLRSAISTAGDVIQAAGVFKAGDGP